MLRRLSLYGDRIIGRIVKWLLRLLRRTDPDRAADLCGAIARTIGPLLPAHRTGRANLRAAYPGQGRRLDRGDVAWRLGQPRPGRRRIRASRRGCGTTTPITPTPAASHRRRALFRDLLDDGKPALCFAAHLGNWELPAVAAAAHGLPSAVVYRMPNNKAVAKEIVRIRAPLMGRLIRTRAQAALEMAAALDRGEHLGMLVDQHFSRGVDVMFFGRRCKANPTVARLARQFDCPVVGVRVMRLPDRRFRIVGRGSVHTAARAGRRRWTCRQRRR